MDSIRVKRGLKQELPKSLPIGELAFCTDSKELYVGMGTDLPLKKVVDQEVIQKQEELGSQMDAKANVKDVNSKIWSMANMGQDVKEAMTGGSVAVVGKDTILTENIVNRQVTPSKTSFITLENNEEYIPEDILQNVTWSEINHVLNEHGIPVNTPYSQGYQCTNLIKIYPNCSYELDCTYSLINYYLYKQDGKSGIQTALGVINNKKIIINTDGNEYFLGINSKVIDGFNKPITLKRLDQTEEDKLIIIKNLSLKEHDIIKDFNDLKLDINTLEGYVSKCIVMPSESKELPYTCVDNSQKLVLNLLPKTDIEHLEVEVISTNIFDIEDLIKIDSNSISRYENGVKITGTNVGKFSAKVLTKQLKPNTTYFFKALSGNNTGYGCGVSIYADTSTTTILLNKGNFDNPSGIFTTTETGLCNFRFYILANHSESILSKVESTFTDILLAESQISLDYSEYNCYSKIYTNLYENKTYSDIFILNLKDTIKFRVGSCDNTIDLRIVNSDIPAFSVNNIPTDSKGNITLPMSHLEGTNIAFFGDSNIGNATSNDIPSIVANLTGATCYNCGFGATRMSTHPQTEWDYFCMHSLADAIVSGDYSKQEANTGLHSTFPTRLATIKSIDWTKIDYIAICHGANDWSNHSSLDSDIKLDYKTFKGGFRYFMDKLYSINPNIKVILITSPYRGVISSSNGLTCDDLLINNKYLMDFIGATFELGKEYKCPVVDIFYTSNINKYNWNRYMSDGAHLDLYGRQFVGNIISKWFIKYLI